MPAAPDMSLAESWSCFLHDLGVWVAHEATQTAEEKVHAGGVTIMTCTAAYLGDAHIELDLVLMSSSVYISILWVSTRMTQSKEDSHIGRVTELTHNVEILTDRSNMYKMQ